MKKEQVISETEEYLNRKSNEKIMEFEEYSSQVIEKIERNHEEVVFMYQMLSDKEDEWKNYISNSKKKEKNMKSLVIAEKPSVARDIARVLHCSQKGNGTLEGKDYVVQDGDIMHFRFNV